MLKRKIIDYIKSLDIEEGQSFRRDCPDCNGINTFSVSKVEGVVKYNCFRGQCNVYGNSYEGMTAQEIIKKIAEYGHTDPCPKIPLMEIPEYVIYPSKQHRLLTAFIERWDLHNAEILYDVKDKRAVFPIREDGRLIDAVGRALDGAIPKWYRYTGTSQVYTACSGKPNGSVVVVEDVISANTICSVCPNVTGMAILGTSLSVKHMEYLQDYVHIIVALDPDAAHKTLTYKQEVASWTGVSTIAMRLQDDIKYKVEEDIIKLKGLLT